MYLKKSLLSLCVMSLLSACGGDDTKNEPVVVVPPVPPVATDFDHQINGTVLFQGALSGTQVCADLDMNKACDDGEPTATSDSDGVYEIKWTSEQKSPSYYIIANWNSPTSSASLPQPLRINITSGFEGGNLSKTNSVSVGASNQLFALNDHDGAVNVFTDIEFQRYQLMLATDKSDAEIQQLRERLAVILKSIYGITSEDVFLLTAAESQSDVLVSTFEIQRYIFALIAELVSDPLAVDEVMSASIAKIRTLIELSQLSVVDYLTTEPLELTYVINDTLIAQGYIEQPISDNLMSPADWDVVFDGLGFKDTPEAPNPEDNFTLAPKHLYSSFTLSYGNEDEHMFGAIVTDPTGAGEPKAFSMIVRFDEENQIHQECWNTDVERWINPNRTDSGYQPKEIEINGNEITTFYDGTEVPIKMRVEKIDTSSDVWTSILSSASEQYKLSKINWPETVYRYFTSQQEKVLCRDEDYVTYSMVASSAQTLSSSNIAETLYPSFYPEDVTVDEVNQRFTVDGLGTYEWQLLELAPNGSSHLRIRELQPEVPDNLQPYVDPSDYLIDSTTFIEVKVYDSWEYDVFNDYLFITFDGHTNDFNQQIKSHFMQFGAP